ncbi:MAG: hypothetical protein R2701_09210 [Acidimicrobiales bacterium]
MARTRPTAPSTWWTSSAAHPARTEIIDGASHAAYDDHPDEFTTLLLGALPA